MVAVDCWRGFKWIKERKEEWDELGKKRGIFTAMINTSTSEENVCCGETENSVQERQNYRALKVR